MLSNKNASPSHAQLKKRIVDENPDKYKAMQASLMKLDKADAQYRLNPSEKLALVGNLRLVLAKSLPHVKDSNSNPTIRARAIKSLDIQLNLPRFRFLSQIPQARTSLLGQLKGTGITFEGIQHEWESERAQQWLFEVPFQTEIYRSEPFHSSSEFEAHWLFESPLLLPQKGTRQKPTFNWRLTPNNDAGMGHLDYRHAPWSKANASKFTQDAWNQLKTLVNETVEKGTIGTLKPDASGKPQAGVVYEHKFTQQTGTSFDSKGKARKLYKIRVVVDANNHVTTTFPF